MGKVVRLTERDLTRIVKRVINENDETVVNKNTQSSSGGNNINRQVFYPHTNKTTNKTLPACKAGDTGTIVSWTTDQMLALSDTSKGGPFCSLKH